MTVAAAPRPGFCPLQPRIVAFLQTREALDWRDVETARAFGVTTRTIQDHWRQLYDDEDTRRRQAYQVEFGPLADLRVCSGEPTTEPPAKIETKLWLADRLLGPLVPLPCQCHRIAASRRSRGYSHQCDRDRLVHVVRLPALAGVRS